MKIQLLVLGKTTEKSIFSLCEMYIKKLGHYNPFVFEVIDNSSIRFENPERVKEEEGKLILKKIKEVDFLILLDENGKHQNSLAFANQLQLWMNAGHKQLVFLVGGPFGFHDSVYKRANARISLSEMTLSHQLIRPVFLEQLYRAFTILRNEPYHHK